MGMAEVQAAIVEKMRAMEGINDSFLGLPDPIPHPPIAWTEVRFTGSRRETCGDAGDVVMFYVGDVHIILGNQDMAEEDARTEAGPFPERMRYAFYTDDTLGGVVWDCSLAETQSTDTLDTYGETENQWPELVYRLHITDHVVANAAAA